MMKLTEFYTERQGRPNSKIARDMEVRTSLVGSLPFLVISGQLTVGLIGGKTAFGGNTDWGAGATGTQITGAGYDWVTQTVGRVNTNLNGTAAAAAYHAMTITANQTSSNSIFGTWTELYVSNSVDLTGADNFAVIWGQFEAGTNVTLSDTGCFTAGGYFNMKAGSTLVIANGHSVNGVRAQLEVSAVTNNGTLAAFECLKSGGVDWEFGLYLADVTTDIRFQEGTTLTDDGTNLTLAGANLVGTLGAVTLAGTVTGGNQNLNNIGHIGLGNQAAIDEAAIYYDETQTPAADTNARALDMTVYAYVTDDTQTAILSGAYFNPIITNANTQNWTNTAGVRGVSVMLQFATGTAAVKTITGAASFYAEAPTMGVSANDMVLTNYYGLYVASRALVSGNKLTNDYGIYIADQAGGATLNYAIYTNAGLVRFGDAVTFAGAVTGISLSEIENLEASKTFTMAAKNLTFNFTTPSEGLTLNVTGAFSDHMLHIHQTQGNPQAGCELIHLQSEDQDIIPLHIDYTADHASCIAIRYQLNRATPTDDDYIVSSYYFDHDADGGAQDEKEFIRITGKATDVSRTSEDASYTIGLVKAGTLTDILTIGSTNITVAATLNTHTIPGGTGTFALTSDMPKVKLETRDMTAGSGDVAYTGYGFQPTGLLILAVLANTAFSLGSSEPALAEHCMDIRSSATPDINADWMLQLVPSGGNYQVCVVKTYDADGFTLTWTRGGSPTGTANLHVFAFK